MAMPKRSPSVQTTSPDVRSALPENPRNRTDPRSGSTRRDSSAKAAGARRKARAAAARGLARERNDLRVVCIEENLRGLANPSQRAEQAAPLPPRGGAP